MKIPNKIRYLNKKFLNRLTLRIAGKMHCPIALIRHSRRKTGRSYATPILAAAVEDGFVFALTYGNHVDWYRNTLASAEVNWSGRNANICSLHSVGWMRLRDGLVFRSRYGQC